MDAFIVRVRQLFRLDGRWDQNDPRTAPLDEYRADVESAGAPARLSDGQVAQSTNREQCHLWNVGFHVNVRNYDSGYRARTDFNRPRFSDCDYSGDRVHYEH